MDCFTEFDDDLFFLHLKRQILLLMVDEDEDEEFPPKPAAGAISENKALLCKQSFAWDCFSHSQERSLPVAGRDPNTLLASSKSTILDTDNSEPGMTQLQICSQRESLGTGVFIPQFRQTKGKSKRGSSNQGSSKQSKNRRSTHQ